MAQALYVGIKMPRNASKCLEHIGKKATVPSVLEQRNVVRRYSSLECFGGPTYLSSDRFKATL